MYKHKQCVDAGRSVDDEVFEGIAPFTALRHLRVHNTIERWPRDFHGYVDAASKDLFFCLESLDLKVALDSKVRVLCAMCITAHCSRLRGLSLPACNMDDYRCSGSCSNPKRFTAARGCRCER